MKKPPFKKSVEARTVKQAVRRSTLGSQSVIPSRKIETLESRYDEQFAVVFEAIKQLVADDHARKSEPKRCIGFRP